VESRDLARGRGREAPPLALVSARGATIALRITDDPDPGFTRALDFEARGQMTAAHRAYVAVLEREPRHLGALTNLGSILHAAGVRDVARAFYTKAVVEHPRDAVARINLGNALVEDGELDAARFHYEAALELVPDHPNGHFALYVLCRELRDAEAAQRHYERAFTHPWIETLPYRGSGTPLRVLVLRAATGGNVVSSLLFDDRTAETTVLYVESFRAGMALPPHDLIFNGIGDADRAGEALGIAATIVAGARVPVLNHPAAVSQTGRAAMARRLHGIAGAVIPRTALLPRDAFHPAELAKRGFGFPLLVRAPGFHTGQHFERVDEADALAATVATLPGDPLLAIEYVDLRDAAGAVRKYRAIAIGGELFPLHLATGAHWKVHYFSAEMRDLEHRADEDAFLRGGVAGLGSRAAATLEAIGARLGLDYGGIDFALDRAGNVVVFEANATMALALPDDDPHNAERRAAVERVIAAFGRRLRSLVPKEPGV
jgi:glutathione synthase/RimK-type ligase-like ATP-grasp enzyme